MGISASIASGFSMIDSRFIGGISFWFATPPPKLHATYTYDTLHAAFNMPRGMQTWHLIDSTPAPMPESVTPERIEP